MCYSCSKANIGSDVTNNFSESIEKTSARLPALAKNIRPPKIAGTGSDFSENSNLVATIVPCQIWPACPPIKKRELAKANSRPFN